MQRQTPVPVSKDSINEQRALKHLEKLKANMLEHAAWRDPWAAAIAAEAISQDHEEKYECGERAAR
jgi:hypothetical protein